MIATTEFVSRQCITYYKHCQGVSMSGDAELHGPKKVNRSWRLTFRVCPIIKHLFLSPDSLRKLCHRTVCEDFVPGQKPKKVDVHDLEYFDKRLHTHWYWQGLAQELWNDIYHRSRLCPAPNSEKVKMALSLELSGILWWNFAYTLILTRCSPRDCQMSFGIGRGFAEDQILNKVNLVLSLEPFGIFW